MRCNSNRIMTLKVGTRFSLAMGMLAVGLCGVAESAQPYLHAPSVDTYAKHDPNGQTILSNGRYLTPAGRHVPVASFPYGLAMTRDGQTLFVASSGAGQIIQDWQSAKPQVIPMESPRREGAGGKQGKPTNAGGADFSPDGKTLYWSSGETGAIYLFVRVTRFK